MDVAICDGESYFAAGADQFVSGTFTDVYMTVDGCDSTIITNLTVNPVYSSTMDVAICDGGSYFAGGANQTQTGIYTDYYTSINGCDSIIITNLSVNNVITNYVDVAICDGESYFAGGSDQFVSGIYTDVFVTGSGCDSTIITNLTVNPVYSSTMDVAICDGESYFAAGADQFVSGTYTDVYMTVDGCDSIIITNLTLNPIYSSTMDVAICDGESYFAAGADQFISGTYTDVFMTVDGCDSIIITNLTVNPVYFAEVFASICEGETYFAAGADQSISGIYNEYFTSISGCDSIIAINLTVNTLPSISAVISDVACNGDANGSINIDIIGNAPYNYLWSNGEISEDISNLLAGTYDVVVTDVNGCSNSDNNIVVGEPSIVTGDVNIITEISCFGSNDGSIEAIGIGGTPPYTYSWDNGGNTSIITGLMAGTYSVSISDVNGCIAEVVQTTPALPWSYSITSTNSTILIPLGSTTINGSPISVGDYVGVFYDYNGSLLCGGYTLYQGIQTAITAWGTDIGGDGFVSGETFNWKVWRAIDGEILDAVATYQTIGFPNTNTYTPGGISGLATLDATGAVYTPSTGYSATLIDPTLLEVSLSGTDVSMFGANDGSIDATITGGIMPYSYLWSNGETTEDLNSLAVGTYFVTVTDANGCIVEDNILISEPIALEIELFATDATCYGGSNGSIDLSIISGTAPFTYLWSNGELSEDISGLIAGTYTVTVNDAAGSSANANVVVNQPTEILVSGIIVDVSCFGGNDGSIDISVTGGSSPYTYLWSHGETTEDASGLMTEVYFIEVTDAFACVVNESFMVNEPMVVDVNIVGTDPNCFAGNDGSAIANVTGGTPPYTYLWSDGSVTEEIFGLMANVLYELIVTDANGCNGQANVTLSEPTAILLSTIISSYNGYGVSGAGLSDGIINLTVSGGTAPYSYLWSNGVITQDLANLSAGTYTVTVTDLNGCIEILSAEITEPTTLSINDLIASNVTCNGGFDGAVDLVVSGGTAPYSYNWSNGVLTEDLSGIGAGVYNITVTDNNLVSVNGTVTIIEPDDLTLTSMISEISCPGGNDGGIDISVLGGTAPYTYMWDDVNLTTTSTLSNLVAGFYSVTITDYNGCQEFASFTIANPLQMNLSFSSTNPTCNSNFADGLADVTVTNGTAPYTYLWSNGATTSAIDNLMEGAYFVTVSDVNNCSASGFVALIGGTVLQSSTMVTDILCYGLSDGAIDLTVSGGNAPFTYLWNTGDTNEDLFGINGGTYDVTISDANGCIIFDQAVVNAATSIEISNTIYDVNCYGESTGAVILSPPAGNFAFAWSNGTANQNLIGVPAGNYTVTLTTSQACSYDTTVTVSQPASPLSYGINEVDISCWKAEDGSIDITPTGGTGPYTVYWSTGDFVEDLDSLKPGIYVCYIFDANYCIEFSPYIFITQPNELVNTLTITDATCGLPNGAIDLFVTGGTPPYLSYDWSNGATTEDIANVLSGEYFVTVVDDHGCEAIDTGFVDSPSSIVTSMYGVDVTCYGDNDGIAGVTVIGGLLPYTYLWSNGETNESISGLTAGTYDVTVTDASGCSVVDSYSILEPNEISIQVVSSNGAATVTVLSGGTAPFAYEWSNGMTYTYIRRLVNNTPMWVFVTDANGCTSDTIFFNVNGGTYLSSVNSESITSIENVQSTSNMVNVYPNPSTDGKFVVEISNTDYEFIKLQIFDAFGKIVYNQKQVNNFENRIEISLNSISVGVYYLQIITNKEVLTPKKLMIVD